MLKDVIDKMFILFFIMKLSGDGMGLGMFILLIIIEEYEGEIEVVS